MNNGNVADSVRDVCKPNYANIAVSGLFPTLESRSPLSGPDVQFITMMLEHVGVNNYTLVPQGSFDGIVKGKK